jgi:hypothetical protein
MSGSSTNLFSKIFSTNNLVKLQALSGISFATFGVLHLFNVALANFGLASAEKVQQIFRLYYQNTYVEPILILGSVGAHMLANTILTMRRWVREKNPKAIKPLTTPQKLNRYAGLMLGILVPTHVMGLRLPSVMWGEEYKGDFSLISFTLRNIGFFIVPASLIGVAGLYHITYGLVQASDKLLRTKMAKRVTENRWFLPLMGIGAGILFSSLMAMKGAYFTLDTARDTFWASYYTAIFRAFGIEANFLAK